MCLCGYSVVMWLEVVNILAIFDYVRKMTAQSSLSMTNMDRFSVCSFIFVLFYRCLLEIWNEVIFFTYT